MGLSAGRTTSAWGRGGRLVAAALLLALAPGMTVAQPTRGRVLRGLDLRSLADGGSEIGIRMGVPVRYLRHAPRSPSDRIEIEITTLGQNLDGLLAQPGDEAVRAPAGAAGPLQEVRFRSGQRRSGRLELLFERPVKLQIKEGSDLRSLLVVVLPERTRPVPVGPDSRPPLRETPAGPNDVDEVTRGEAPSRIPVPSDPAVQSSEAAVESAEDETPVSPPRPVDLAHPFALQLFAAPSGEALPPVDPSLLGRETRLYTVPFLRKGVPWQRLRVGFFASQEEARIARDEVTLEFPGVWVVRVGLEERLESASLAVALGAPLALAIPRKPSEEDLTEPAATKRPPAKTPPTETPQAATALADTPLADTRLETELQMDPSGSRESAASTAGAPLPPVAELPPAEAEEVALMLSEGRNALAGGQHDRAVQLFTKVLSFPENTSTPEALEWLGLARERKGQLAHARAEYQAYLEHYPEGEGAERVHQRLEALVTARAEAPPALRPASTKDRTADFDVFGSIATGYRRDERFTDDFGDSLVDSSIYSDLFVGSRWQNDQWDVRSELSGTHLFDFIDNDERWRVNTLFIEAEGLGNPWNLGVGRLPGNRGGVVGRFDGAEVSYELRPGVRFGTTLGFPVDPFLRTSPDLDQQLLGLDLRLDSLTEGLDVEFFAIRQWAEGFTDRTAVGTEFRYAAEGRFFAGLLDYDVHFNELNTAFVVGNVRLRPDTDVNVLIDWRRLPTLGTRNALFGQQDDSLRDLHDLFGTGEIESLAEDRTARSRSVSVGLTHRLNERFQISGDVAISDLSGTPASGGIEAFEGTGRQISTFLQATGSELFADGDIGSLGLRWIDARTVEILGFNLSWRSPMWRRLRLNPLLDLEWRDAQDREGVFLLRPGFRIDLRVGRITLDVEGHYRWSFGERFPGVGDEQGYSILFGARYDY